MPFSEAVTNREFSSTQLRFMLRRGSRMRAVSPKVQRLLEHREQIQKLIDDLELTVLPLTAEHSFKLFGLPAPHGDPFDRT